MTRDGTVGRFRRNREKPAASSGHRSRSNDEDSVRGPHQGQQSTRTAPTGRTHDCKRPLRCTPNDLLPGGGHPHMRRRELIALLAGAAVAWPLAARAQQAGKTPRVGYIRAGTPNNDPFREEFVRGMRDLGYIEGRNIAYEFRHYGDDVESIPSLIGDLLRAKVDIIVVGGTAAIRAAQRATQSIP